MMMPSLFTENLFDDFFNDFDEDFFGKKNPLYGKHARNMMKTDVRETDTTYEVDVDLPGFKKEDINVNYENGYLTISTSKGLDKDEKDKDGRYIRQERYVGNMTRSFYLGDIPKEDIKAKYEGGRCLCTAFKALSFYMNYETKDGGKEHYNDIIAQYNAIYAECFKNAGEAAHDGDVKAVKALALFAAGAVDTLEVMDQALYEIFARIREMYKAAVSVLNDTIDNTDSWFVKLIYAYAVLKGCRMKLIQTEKYASKAEEIFEKAADKHVADKSGVAVSAAYITAYSEYIRNRDYQDYGRSNGGVLWS